MKLFFIEKLRLIRKINAFLISFNVYNTENESIVHSIENISTDSMVALYKVPLVNYIIGISIISSYSSILCIY